MISPPTTPLYILGAGSIGLLVASSIRLKNPTFPVRLLLRSTHKNKIKTYGRELKINHINDKIVIQTDPRISKLIQSKLDYDFHAQSKDKTEHYSSNNNTYVLVAMKSMGDNTITLVDIPAEIIQNENDKNECSIRNLLLTTKAIDARKALSSIAHRFVEPTSQIIVLCNGTLAVLDELRTNHFKAHLISASITHGANRGSEDDFHDIDSIFERNNCFHVVHAGIGSIYIENHCSADILDVLQSAGLNAYLLPEEHMNMMHWKKLVANCTINPLTALRKVLNGQLAVSSNNMNDYAEKNITQPRYMDKNILSELVYELSQVAQAESFSKSPETYLSFDNLLGFVQGIIRDTAHNRSSMLQDVDDQRITEVDYLNGYVVMLGRKYGIDMNANEYIVEEIKRVERSFTS